MFNKKINVKLIIIVIAVIGIFICAITTYNYPRGFNIEITNCTDEKINKITFKPGAEIEDEMAVTNIGPQEKIKVQRTFNKSGENFYAVVEDSTGNDFIIPLGYVYYKNDINVAKLYITNVEDHKIKEVTTKSFTGGTPLNLPWWIRVYYDYAVNEVMIP